MLRVTLDPAGDARAPRPTATAVDINSAPAADLQELPGVDHDAVGRLGTRHRDLAFLDVAQDQLRVTRQRIAITAATAGLIANGRALGHGAGDRAGWAAMAPPATTSPRRSPASP